MAQIKDLTNKKFNKLTALKMVGKTKKGNALWLFKCDCGRQKNMSGSNVASGKSKSCGYCVNKYAGTESLVNSKYATYRKSAENRNYLFLLSFEQAKELLLSDCFYCGCPPSRPFSHNRGGLIENFNGIDRKDNIQGYTIDNCVPCCRTCNFAKHDMSTDEFYDWINQLIEFRTK